MCFLPVMDQCRAWCYMILDSIVYRFLRGLAMPEKAAIDIGSIICDAYADLVSGYAPILLAIASPLYIPLDHLQICLIKIHLARKHYPILRALQCHEDLVYPVSRCIVCLSVRLRDCLETLLREQFEAGAYPFAYRLLMVLEKCSCRHRECLSALKTAVSPQSRPQIAISLVYPFLAVRTARWFKCVEKLTFHRIGDPGMPAAVFYCHMIVEERLKRRH